MRMRLANAWFKTYVSSANGTSLIRSYLETYMALRRHSQLNEHDHKARCGCMEPGVRSTTSPNIHTAAWRRIGTTCLFFMDEPFNLCRALLHNTSTR